MRTICPFVADKKGRSEFKNFKNFKNLQSMVSAHYLVRVGSDTRIGIGYFKKANAIFKVFLHFLPHIENQQISQKNWTINEEKPC